MLLRNGSRKSMIRAGISIGTQQLFRKLGNLGVLGTRKVSDGVDNEVSEFIIDNTAGEVGKLFDKVIQDKLKDKHNER